MWEVPWVADEVLDRHPAHCGDDKAGNAPALPDHPDEQAEEGEALQLGEQKLLRCEPILKTTAKTIRNISVLWRGEELRGEGV